jgi:hypothetical protein
MQTSKFPSVFCVYSPTQGEARQLCMSPFYLSPCTFKLISNYTDDLHFTFSSQICHQSLLTSWYLTYSFHFCAHCLTCLVSPPVAK